jgi:hypothetical protein
LPIGILSLEKPSYEGEQHASTPLVFGSKSSIVGAIIFRNHREDRAFVNSDAGPWS